MEGPLSTSACCCYSDVCLLLYVNILAGRHVESIFSTVTQPGVFVRSNSRAISLQPCDSIDPPNRKLDGKNEKTLFVKSSEMRKLSHSVHSDGDCWSINVVVVGGGEGRGYILNLKEHENIYCNIDLHGSSNEAER